MSHTMPWGIPVADATSPTPSHTINGATTLDYKTPLRNGGSDTDESTQPEELAARTCRRHGGCGDSGLWTYNATRLTESRTMATQDLPPIGSYVRKLAGSPEPIDGTALMKRADAAAERLKRLQTEEASVALRLEAWQTETEALGRWFARCLEVGQTTQSFPRLLKLAAIALRYGKGAPKPCCSSGTRTGWSLRGTLGIPAGTLDGWRRGLVTEGRVLNLWLVLVERGQHGSSLEHGRPIPRLLSVRAWAIAEVEWTDATALRETYEETPSAAAYLDREARVEQEERRTGTRLPLLAQAPDWVLPYPRRAGRPRRARTRRGAGHPAEAHGLRGKARGQQDRSDKESQQARVRPSDEQFSGPDYPQGPYQQETWGDEQFRDGPDYPQGPYNQETWGDEQFRDGPNYPQETWGDEQFRDGPDYPQGPYHQETWGDEQFRDGPNYPQETWGDEQFRDGPDYPQGPYHQGTWGEASSSHSRRQ
ncbi:hypothetical protein DFH27DRAFT_609827 [Peziza echinospora]|nr:hypothetical protein DFH27DRAFT_609827 [Peziza echinospora]